LCGKLPSIMHCTSRNNFLTIKWIYFWNAAHICWNCDKCVSDGSRYGPGIVLGKFIIMSMVICTGVTLLLSLLLGEVYALWTRVLARQTSGRGI
jgi:hypothetical protein